MHNHGHAPLLAGGIRDLEQACRRCRRCHMTYLHQRCGVVVDGALLLALLAGCSESSGGVPDAGSDAIHNVLEKVDLEHPDNPWWAHVIEDVNEGILADITFQTNYEVGDPELKAFCEAVLDAVGDEDALVNFYGFRTETHTEVDGSKTSQKERANLMNGMKESGCTPGVFGHNTSD